MKICSKTCQIAPLKKLSEEHTPEPPLQTLGYVFEYVFYTFLNVFILRKILSKCIPKRNELHLTTITLLMHGS